MYMIFFMQIVTWIKNKGKKPLPLYINIYLQMALVLFLSDIGSFTSKSSSKDKEEKRGILDLDFKFSYKLLLLDENKKRSYPSTNRNTKLWKFGYLKKLYTIHGLQRKYHSMQYHYLQDSSNKVITTYAVDLTYIKNKIPSDKHNYFTGNREKHKTKIKLRMYYNPRKKRD